MSDHLAEESWEAGISYLLGGLPAVEPPEGFLDDVLDHPPLHAGRILAGLVATSLLALVAVAALLAGGPGAVIPQVDALASRHAAARADLFGGDRGAASGDAADAEACPPVEACGGNWVTLDVESPVSLPDGYAPAGGFAADDLRQAVYAGDDDAVSVFVQPGRLDWSNLPEEGRRDVGGVRAWVDPQRLVTVLATDDEVVTVIGLPADELGALVAGLPERQRSAVAGPLGDVAELLARHLGLATS